MIRPPPPPRDDPHVEWELPYAGEEEPTGKSAALTVRGRVDSLLADAQPADQERALRLLEHWLTCGTESQHAIAWMARLLARPR